MGNWTMRDDDRTYLRPQRRSLAWVAALAVALIVGLIAGYYLYLLQRQGPPMAPPQLLGPEPQSAAAPPPAAQAEVRRELDVAPSQRD